MSRIRVTSRYKRVEFQALFDAFLSDPLRFLDRLEQFSDINELRMDDGRTFMHQLAMHDNGHHLLEYLLRRGASPKLQDDLKETPMGYAVNAGQRSACEVLVEYGGFVESSPLPSSTPIYYALQQKNASMARYVVKLGGELVAGWSPVLFKRLCKFGVPALVHDYLDHFRMTWKQSSQREGYVWVRYRDMNHIYGRPDVPVTDTTLAVILEYPDMAAEVLAHGLMTYVMRAKWKAFAKRHLIMEATIFVILLVSTYTALVFRSELSSKSTLPTTILEIISLACSIVFLFVKGGQELRTFGARRFFGSGFNLLGIATYICIILAAVLDLADLNTDAHSLEAMELLMSIAIMLLGLSSLKYLQVFPVTDVLVAMMVQMLADVSKFVVLYIAFLLGFSGAFYILFRGHPRFENFPNALVATFFMLFGDFSGDLFLGMTGSRWVVSNLLLLLYLMSVMVMLLNILIAMMSTRYEDVSNRAHGERNRNFAEAIVRIESVLPQSSRIRAYNSLIKYDKSLLFDKLTTVKPDGTSVVTPAAPNSLAATETMNEVPIATGETKQVLSVQTSIPAAPVDEVKMHIDNNVRLQSKSFLDIKVRRDEAAKGKRIRFNQSGEVLLDDVYVMSSLDQRPATDIGKELQDLRDVIADIQQRQHYSGMLQEHVFLRRMDQQEQSLRLHIESIDKKHSELQTLIEESVWGPNSHQ